ncbi:MAG: hypothetical protein K2M44_06270 [Clostridia bacterium]|nr:hypothetical protein [Clostridia bacterium]
MIIVKKNVVLKDADKSGAGVLKLEKFLNRTSGHITMNCPVGSIAYIEIDGSVATVDASAPFTLSADINRDSEIKTVIIYDGSILATGNSAGGKFDYSALTGQKKAEREVNKSEQVSHTSAKPEESIQDVAANDNDSSAAAQSEPVEENSERQQQAKSASSAKGKKRKSTKNNFLDSVKDNLDKLFDTYPLDDELCAVTPSSRWVRVPTEDDNYYVVGITEEEGNPRYLCYGIPDKDNSVPPKGHPECRDWLPIEEDGRGYWMMYQDLDSGEIVKK